MTIGFPTIDGHFWIERDGKIVDIEFKEYDLIKTIHNLADGMVYKEADTLTQTVMIKKFEMAMNNMGYFRNTFKTEIVSGYFPRVNCCFQTCMMAYKEGDVLKFGSMGWRNKLTGDVWWEFGGEDWKGVAKFLK